MATITDSTVAITAMPNELRSAEVNSSSLEDRLEVLPGPVLREERRLLERNVVGALERQRHHPQQRERRPQPG